MKSGRHGGGAETTELPQVDAVAARWWQAPRLPQGLAEGPAGCSPRLGWLVVALSCLAHKEKGPVLWHFGQWTLLSLVIDGVTRGIPGVSVFLQDFVCGTCLPAVRAAVEMSEAILAPDPSYVTCFSQGPVEPSRSLQG